MQRILEGKVALVTGGSRNIGRQTALRLAEQGADIVITYRSRKEEAEQSSRDIEQMGVRCGVIRADLTGTGDLDRLVLELNALLADWGHDRIDILVNNAGILRLGTFEQVSEDDLDANYLTNFKSVFFLIQRLAPRIADGGKIVNLGSGTARIAFAPLISYGPFKAALQSLTLYLASYFGKRGITVNAVAPGGLDDDFNAGLFETMPPAIDFIRSNTALGRLGKPNDIAAVIAFLCGPQADFISGSVVNIDGGFHL